MPAIKTCKTTGNMFIQFKTIGASVQVDGNWRETPNYDKKVLKMVGKHSEEFTGTNIADQFQESNGNWKLYGKHPFKGTDGFDYYWTGVDTENWKGFSVKIVRIIP